MDLRDGNQALANPMNTRRKGMFFDLLVDLGFKDIEVGYPSSSEADFDFVRKLIVEDRIPDDVTISVFTPARPELIDRTFDALRDCDQAVVHLCNATACLWREVVFGMTAQEVHDMAVGSAEHMMRRADAAGGSLRFEYSPETFNVTEPDFALEISNAIAEVVDACPDRPLILNLPTTVETDGPDVFADQVEWMHVNLDRRESIILSVHPHNDRGTAVASAELALLAGADRVEGTLFGNGERTGNVCLATLAMNLVTRGVDAQLDFSDIDRTRAVVEQCNQMPVPDRHPYVGSLVYTAFSGTHQDAIAKGLAALEARARAEGKTAADLPWDVPYLPIDPRDVGRSYESVVRVNSQSGKGGIGYVLKSEYGFDLPRDLRVEFAQIVQGLTEGGDELTPAMLRKSFLDEYVRTTCPLRILALDDRPSMTVELPDGDRISLPVGDGLVSTLVKKLNARGYDISLDCLYGEDVLDECVGGHEFVYARVLVAGIGEWGVGRADGRESAELVAAVSAVNRALTSMAASLPGPAKPA